MSEVVAHSWKVVRKGAGVDVRKRRLLLLVGR